MSEIRSTSIENLVLPWHCLSANFVWMHNYIFCPLFYHCQCFLSNVKQLTDWFNDSCLATGWRNKWKYFSLTCCCQATRYHDYMISHMSKPALSLPIRLHWHQKLVSFPKTVTYYTPTKLTRVQCFNNCLKLLYCTFVDMITVLHCAGTIVWERSRSKTNSLPLGSFTVTLNWSKEINYVRSQNLVRRYNFL